MPGVNLIEGYVFRLVARYGLAANISSGAQFLLGEMGWDTDKKVFRVGDGTSAPVRIMSDKSVGTFDFSSTTWVKFRDIQILANGKVDGVRVNTLNGANGFTTRTEDGVFANRTLTSGDGTITFSNPAGVSGNPDIRVSSSLITQLTPPLWTAQASEPTDPRIGDYWLDTDDSNKVYVRGFNGANVPNWYQVSNETVNATTVVIGVTRFSTNAEAQARDLASVAVTPSNLIAVLGSGNDFRTVESELSAPPVSPTILNSHLVGVGASGAWAGQSGKVATYNGTSWVFEQLRLGAIIVNKAIAVSNPARIRVQLVALTWTNFVAASATYGLMQFAPLYSELVTGTRTDAAPGISAVSELVLKQPRNLMTIGGTANAITATITPGAPGVTSWTNLIGVELRGFMPLANTSDTVTMNVNGFGNRNVVRQDGTPPKPNDINNYTRFVYDGTNVRIVGLVPSSAGRLINIQVITASGTYTPSDNMAFCIMEAVGGGGGGGGGTNPSAGNVSLGAPGTAATWTRARFTKEEVGASKTVVIGAGGLGVAGSAGTMGGETGVIGLLAAPGGVGGSVLNNQVPPTANGNGSVSGAASGANIASRSGTAPAPSVGFSATGGYGAAGGDSPLGAGGYGVNPNNNGANALGNGGGGGGICLINGGGTGTGGNGSPGLVIVLEYGA